MNKGKKIRFLIIALILLISGLAFGYAYTIGNSNLTFWFGNLFVFLTIFSITLLFGLCLLGLYIFKSETNSNK